MAKFQVRWWVIGGDEYEDEVDFPTESDAYQFAQAQAMSLVCCSVERIDPLTEDERLVLQSKAIAAFAELPLDIQEKVLEAFQMSVAASRAIASQEAQP